MRSIYTKTLYQKRFFMLGWSLSLVALIAFTIVFFPSLKTGELATSFENLPESLQALAGDAAAFQTIDGYVSQQVFLLRAPMMLLILTIILFAGLTAGEEQKRLVETQLSLPIRRSKLLLQKLLVGLTVSIVTTGSVLLGIMLGVVAIRESYSIMTGLPLAAAALLVSLSYALLAFAIGAATGRRGLALGITSGVTLFGFVINSMAASIESLASLDKLTFLHYYSPSDMSLQNWLILSAICIVFIVIGFVGFVRRDLQG